MATENPTMMARAYRHIRAGLAAGEFPPGSQLSELAIAEQVGVGRTPVREALVVLENEGFLQQVPRYGTFVKKAERHERQSMYELREMLESYAAGKAAHHMDRAGVVRLESLCEATHEIATSVRDGASLTDDLLSRAVTADLAFHMVILQESGNSHVIKIVNDLHLMGRIWGTDRNDPHDQSIRLWASTWQEHYRIYRAIKRHDGAQASFYMGEHLRHATRDALDFYDRQCRTQSAESIGHGWPKVVRDAISQLEMYGPDHLTSAQKH